MTYSTKKTLTHALELRSPVAAVADNTDIFAFKVPAKREVQLFDFNAVNIQSTSGASFLELVRDDNTIIARVQLQLSGIASAVAATDLTSASLPIRVARLSDTVDRIIKVRTDQSVAQGTVSVVSIVLSGVD